MRKQALGLVFLCALAGCGGSSLVGSWQSNNGAQWTFRDGDSVTLRDTNGSDYSGNWREVGSSQVEITFTGLMGLGGPEICSYQISAGNGLTNLFVNGCTFQGIYHKR